MRPKDKVKHPTKPRPKELFRQEREIEMRQMHSRRRRMVPWDGKDHPPFEVEEPWDGKDEFSRLNFLYNGNAHKYDNFFRS